MVGSPCYRGKNSIDLSEKQVAWFLHSAVPEDDPYHPDQAGEGYRPFILDTDSDIDAPSLALEAFDNYGGVMYNLERLLAAGIGPALEKDIPYTGGDGYYCRLELFSLSEDYSTTGYEVIAEGQYYDLTDFVDIVNETAEKYTNFEDVYSGIKELDTDETYYLKTINFNGGDWSVPESSRYISVYPLAEVNLLPSPTGMRADGSYYYNELGTLAIKKELYSGHGVSIGVSTDYAKPGDKSDPDITYLKFSNLDGSEPKDGKGDIWAEYTFDTKYDPNDPDSKNSFVESDHALVLVGYDDNFPKEYFNDPNGLIGGDGAFIARNSWGCAGHSNPYSDNYWGNGGDGYFYISYYDQSFAEPLSFVFDVNGNDRGKTEMYDMLPTACLEDIFTADFDVYTANVFTADEDEVLKKIGVSTSTPNCTVDYTVYLLDDNSADPTDGVKVAGSEITFDYSGYHTVELGKPVRLSKGQRYSVVAETVREDGKTSIQINFELNKNGIEYAEEYFKANYIDEYGTEDGYFPKYCYACTVVNKGESFIGARTKDGVEWSDWTDVIEAVTSDNAEVNNDGYVYDNFSLRAYTEPVAYGDVSASVSSSGSSELLDIITASVSDTFGIDSSIGNIWYIGRDIFAIEFDDGYRFYRITDEAMEAWRSTGKLKAEPVALDSRLDGIRLNGNFGLEDLDETDYLLLYLKDYFYSDTDNQYRFVVKYNKDKNSLDLVATGDLNEINGVTKSGYLYRYEYENNVFLIYITDLSTGATRRVSMDYSRLGEAYPPIMLLPSYVENDEVVFYQCELSETPTGVNKGALWKIDMATGEITRLEKHDCYAMNGYIDSVFYQYFENSMYSSLRLYVSETGEIYDITDMGMITADDGTVYYLSAFASRCNGTKVIAEYTDETNYWYALADIAECELLTELVPSASRTAFTITEDGSFLFGNEGKWEMYGSDGKVQLRHDDIALRCDAGYALVTDNGDMFFVDGKDKAVSYTRSDAIGGLYSDGKGLYIAALADGSIVLLTYAPHRETAQAEETDANPATGTSGFAGMFLMMCTAGIAAAATKKKK